MVLVAYISKGHRIVLQVMWNTSDYEDKYIETERLAALTTNSGGPWQSIAMDFMGPFSECMGYDYLLVVICHLTSLVHLIPTTTSAKATETMWLFLKDIV
jgi:hypothetical protein